MAIEPIQEVPGAPPEPELAPQSSEPDLATFVADLNKLQKFTSEEAAQLWSIYLRSLDELKRIRGKVAGKAGESEAGE